MGLYDDILGDDKTDNGLYDNILDEYIEQELNGFTFKFISVFKILDTKHGFHVSLHKLFKRSYKSHESEMTIIMKENPINIKNISNLEISDFKINKQYKGFFYVDFYENKTFDIFLTDYENI